MGFGFPEMRRVREAEWMDEEGVDAGELDRALGYIRRVNKYLGYNRATRGRVMAWADGWGREESVSVLDVATGSLDVPIDLEEALGRERRGGQVGWVGLDLHEVTIGRAAAAMSAYDVERGVLSVGGVGTKWCEWARGPMRCLLVRGDALRLPFADGSVDYVMTSMFLHHLSEEEATTVLREMWRVARRGALAADLLRSRWALAGVWALSRLSSKMIRHDATVSVRQAFTVEEVAEMARAAGWAKADVRRHPCYRFTMVADKAR